MASGKKIIVIGAGAVGLSTAYYALEKGHAVTIIERGGPGHDCCSKGNAGLVVPSHVVPLAAPGMVAMGLRMLFDPEGPFGIRPRLNLDLFRWGLWFCRSCTDAHAKRSAPLLAALNLASRACFEELEQLPRMDFGLRRKGLLVLCRTDAAMEKETEAAQVAHAHGVDSQVVSPGQVAAFNPRLKTNVAGGIHFKSDCHLDPNRFVESLTGKIRELGGRFIWNAPLVDWETEDSRIRKIRTPDASYEADEFVIAAGSWSAQLAHELGVRLLLEAGKGHNVTLTEAPYLPEVPMILTEARVAVTPLGNSLRLGGTMEFSGLEQTISHRRVEGFLKQIPHYFPDYRAADFEHLPVWTGLRPCSPDGLPYLGRVPQWSNLVIATGHAMMGLSLGPITGKLAAELLSEESPSFDIRPLRPERFDRVMNPARAKA